MLLLLLIETICFNHRNKNTKTVKYTIQIIIKKCKKKININIKINNNIIVMLYTTRISRWT
jgi:hypothetical protein